MYRYTRGLQSERRVSMDETHILDLSRFLNIHRRGNLQVHARAAQRERRVSMDETHIA